MSLARAEAYDAEVSSLALQASNMRSTSIKITIVGASDKQLGFAWLVRQSFHLAAILTVFGLLLAQVFYVS